jgi:DNA-binding LacI/PurR family transcriptional regulator
MEMASFVTPRLTTISQPAYEMGKISADVLLNKIGAKSHRPVHKILKTNLVIRESTTIAPSKKQERSGMKDMTVY